MAAAITTAVSEQLGAPLGSLLLTLATQEWALTQTTRVISFVDFWALDGNNNPFAFQYALTTGGTYAIVPAGGMVTLPFYGATMSYFFKYASAAATVYGATSG